MSEQRIEEPATGNPRFEFGENWKSFLAVVDDERIEAAVESLRQLLDTDSLAGTRFLDLGCGSGLFSLAAQRLGADVESIDADMASVACCQELKRRFGDPSRHWQVRHGSVLDKSLMQSLAPADVVYSWGVLHHTGNLRGALALAADRTRPGGRFCVALYNDQGSASIRWLSIKRCYHRLPSPLRPLWVALIAAIYEGKFALARLSKRQNPLPFADWRAKQRDRGMSVWHDWVDWIGGLPFEVVAPEDVESALEKLDFTLLKARLIGTGWGCNEFVFRRAR